MRLVGAKEFEPLFYTKSKTIREMVELLFPVTLRQDMKDCCLDTLFSLGKACGPTD
jgi:hypothetical protein